MVFYFTSTTKAGTFTIYMGRDKHENELLIQHGWPEDVWFHVDDLSSAHVYLRLPEGMYVKQIPAEVLADCAQLVKANSIEGNKKATGGVKIVYTLWANLLKNGSMAIGQVGFKNGRDIYYTNADTRDNAIVNRLNKTRVEKDTSEIKGQILPSLYVFLITHFLSFLHTIIVNAPAIICIKR